MNVFKLEEYLAKYEFSAKYLLCCSDAESFLMSEILEMASPQSEILWNNLRLGYTEAPGSPHLRDLIAKQLYPGLTSDNILTFAGAEDGIFCTLNTIITSSDHVIILTPCYQSLLEIPKAKGADITEIELKEKNEWRIDLDIIENSIKRNTKAIIINFPHNPTGQVIEETELKALAELCDSKGIWLFADEVYRLMGKPHIALFEMSGMNLDLILLVIIVMLCILPFALFLHTDFGLRFRTIGKNSNFAVSYGIGVKKYRSFGLFIAGSMFGLAGSLIVQIQQFMDIGIGVGIVIHGLASLMIGESIVGNDTIKRQLLAPVVGALIYQQIQGLALSFGLAPSDLKFFTGSIVLIVLAIQKRVKDVS